MSNSYLSDFFKKLGNSLSKIFFSFFVVFLPISCW